VTGPAHPLVGFFEWVMRVVVQLFSLFFFSRFRRGTGIKKASSRFFQHALRTHLPSLNHPSALFPMSRLPLLLSPLFLLHPWDNLSSSIAHFNLFESESFILAPSILRLNFSF